MAHPQPSESKWGGPKVALGAVVALAAVLRLAGERARATAVEKRLVEQAWEIGNGRGFDPHPFFDHPSALLYALAPWQAWESAPSHANARYVVVGLALLGVAAAWWLGARAYDRVAGAVAAATTAVATAHVAASQHVVPEVALALAATVALALLVAGRFELAGLAAGTAAACDYPGFLLLLPLVVGAWRQWRRLAVAATLLVAGFAATSPFALVHLGEAAADAAATQRLARDASLAPIAWSDRIWESVGPAIAVGVVGLALALVQRRLADRVLVAFTLVWVANLLTLDSSSPRHLLPLVPVLGVLAGRVRTLAAVTFLLLVVPLTWSIRNEL